MKRLPLLILAAIIGLAVAAFVALSVIPLPSPSAAVEKTIPNDRLAR